MRFKWREIKAGTLAAGQNGKGTGHLLLSNQENFANITRK
jgi:hypothetical protein